jgi:site-specific DNA-methyltransferase (adenine-specific)
VEGAAVSAFSVHCADSLRWLANYEGEPFDAVITDPPYSSGGATRGDRAMPSRVKYVTSTAHHSLPSFAGDNRDQRGFLVWCSMWLADAYRVTLDGGILVVFCDWRQLPVMTDAVQVGGWVWRGIVPWHKPGARPQTGRFAAACEYAVWASKGPHVPWDGAPCAPGMFSMTAPRARIHITEKPVSLARELVQVVRPGGLVLDPFLGSGALAEGFLLEGRRVVGVEMLPQYAARARARLSAACASSNLAAAEAGQIAMFGGSAL